MKTKLLKVFALCACFIMFFSGCGFNSGTALMKVENSTKTSWKQSHMLLDGKQVRTFSLGNEPQEMEVTVVTEKGEIDITVLDSNGEEIFEIDDAKTGTYEFTAFGKIKIEVEADSHKGNFEIKRADS